MIKDMLKRTGMSKVGMAKLLGVHRMTIRNFYQDRLPKSMKNYIKVCEYVIDTQGLDKLKELIQEEI
jgi:DNA-binding XRE family transcriptional regulator